MKKRYALRTSVGPLSAGTRFEVLSLNETAGYATIKSLSPICKDNEQLTQFDIQLTGYAILDVEADKLVELRR